MGNNEELPRGISEQEWDNFNNAARVLIEFCKKHEFTVFITGENRNLCSKNAKVTYPGKAGAKPY